MGATLPAFLAMPPHAAVVCKSHHTSSPSLSCASGDTSYLGNNCTARCATGFVGVDVQSATYSCAPTGVWALQSPALRCTRTIYHRAASLLSYVSAAIDCGPLLSVSSGGGSVIDGNSTSYCRDTKYLSAPCPVLCNPGYVGNSTYTCLSRGIWFGAINCTRLYSHV